MPSPSRRIPAPLQGLGTLTLQSNADGAGAEALTLNAATGAVNFGVATTLLGGTLTDRSDIAIASAPTLILGNVTGLALHSIGSLTDLTATGAITLGTVNVANALIVNNTTGQIATGGLTSTAGDITVDAGAGAVAITGAVSAAGNYSVTGNAVTLDAGVTTAPPGPVTQSADGTVTITATTGNISGLGSLILQSNADGAGAEALTLDAAAGVVNFGTGTALLGGTLADRSNVLARSASTITLGNVTGLGLRSIGNLTTLAATGAIVLGDVDVATALNITGVGVTAGGLSTTTGNITVNAGAGTATVAGNVTTPGDYSVTGGSVTLGTNLLPPPTVTQKANGAVTITATTGTISGLGYLTLQSNANGAGAEALKLDAAGTVNFGAGTTLLGGTLANRSDIMVASAPALTLGNVTGLALHSIGNPTTLSEAGAITLGTVNVMNALIVNSTVGPIATGGLTSTTGGITVNAGTGPATVAGNVAASGNYSVTGSTVTLGTAATTVTQTAGGTIAITGNATGPGALTLNAGGAITLGDLAVTDALVITSTAGPIGTGGLSSTTSDIDVDAGTGTATVAGAVSAPGHYNVSGSAVTLGATAATVTQAVDGAVTITANTGAITGLGNLTLQSNADGAGAEVLTLNAVAGAVNFGTGTTLLGGTLANRSNIAIASAPTLTLGNVTGLAPAQHRQPGQPDRNRGDRARHCQCHQQPQRRQRERSDHDRRPDLGQRRRLAAKRRRRGQCQCRRPRCGHRCADIGEWYGDLAEGGHGPKRRLYRGRQRRPRLRRRHARHRGRPGAAERDRHRHDHRRRRQYRRPRQSDAAVRRARRRRGLDAELPVRLGRFGAGTTLLGGTLANRADIAIASAPTLTLGNVTGLALHSNRQSDRPDRNRDRHPRHCRRHQQPQRRQRERPDHDPAT